MSEDFVRDVLREHAEGDMPPVKDPWPAIREKVLASRSVQPFVSSYQPLQARPDVERTTPNRGRSRFRISMAMAMMGLLAMAAGSITFLALNGPGSDLGTSPVSGCWGIVASPNVASSDTVLTALSANAANDVWAAGYSRSTGVAQTLVQRWDGQRWSIVPGPNIPSRDNYLTGVAALSSNNVWVAGYTCAGDCATDTTPLVQHWNGAQWSTVPVPGNGKLNGIEAVSTNDIWAVGYRGSQPLSMHWDGQKWGEVPTNNPPLGNRSMQLKAVVSLSSNDVWAVGEEYDPAANTYSGATYHWDGTLWRYVSTGGENDRLSAVAATSAKDIWAVGERGNSAVGEQRLQTVTKRWDGARWLEVPSPSIGAGDSYLRGVAAISPTDAWAVGGYGPRTGTKQTLVLHWDGTAWNVVPSPNVEGQSNRFFGVDALSAREIWAVGTYNKTGTGAFIERFYNPCTITRPTLPVPIVPDIKDPTALPGFGVERPLP